MNEAAEAQRARGKGQRGRGLLSPPGPPPAPGAPKVPRFLGDRPQLPGALRGGGSRRREAHKKANGAGAGPGGRGASGHQRPLGLKGATFQGHTLRRLPPARASVAERDASEGRAGTWGSFFRQDEHPRHQSRGRGGGGRGGLRRRPPAPQPAVPAQHHGHEEGRGGRVGASPRPSRGQRALIGGSGAGSSSAYLPPSPRPGPGPSNKSSSEGVRGQKRERTPRSSRATQKSSVIQGLGRGARGAALPSCRPGAGRGGRQGLGAGEGPRHCVLAFTSSL